jgi:hypothetical protein
VVEIVVKSVPWSQRSETYKTKPPQNEGF